MAQIKSRKSGHNAGGGGPTLADVSRVAGVSTATISRVLNNPELVAERTRDKVHEAVKQTGYVPNLLAGGLASSRSRLVAAFVPGIATSIFNETIEAMTRELAAAGYLVVLGFLSEDADEMERTITQLLARRPDGLILTSAESSILVRRRLKASQVTVIETWDLPARPLDVAIGFSHLAVGRAVGEMVIGKGYRRPLIITADTKRAKARLQGVQEAFAAIGVEPQCDLAPVGGAGAVNGRERFRDFLDGGGEADVVICGSDMIAQGVLIEASARGLKVPADVAVVGFGGTEGSAYSHPPLTTVRIDGSAIGRQAAQILIDRSQGLEPKRNRIDVGFELIVRDSV